MVDSQTSSNAVYNGSYQTRQEHQLKSDILASARNSLESVGAKFANDVINDEIVRRNYTNGINRVSQLVKSEVDAGNISVQDGAKYCNELRNKILTEARKASSPAGRAYAIQKKPIGPTLNESLDKYSEKLYGKSFSQLSDNEKVGAQYAVVESAGRNDARVTNGTRILKTAGKVAILITAALAVGAILSADDKVTETARQGTVVQGGVLGGYLAGLAAASICGPGAPFCAVAVMIIGAMAGTISSEYAFNAYDDELKEFRTWGIR